MSNASDSFDATCSAQRSQKMSHKSGICTALHVPTGDTTHESSTIDTASQEAFPLYPIATR